MKVKNLDASQLKVEAALVADMSPLESQQNVRKLLYFLFLFYIIMYLPTTFYTYKSLLQDGDSIALRHCAFCLKVCGFPVKFCGGCKKRAYCSKKCQVTDWKVTRNG